MAGVSQSAVSRTFSGATNVSEGDAQKVLNAAKRLDYRPSLIPRIMLTHKSNLVAIVVGGLYNPGSTRRCSNNSPQNSRRPGTRCCSCMSPSDHALDAVIPKLGSYRVDAIISALAILSPRAAADAGQPQDPGHFLQYRREERMGHPGVMRQYRSGTGDRRSVRATRGTVVRLHFRTQREPCKRRKASRLSRN